VRMGLGIWIDDFFMQCLRARSVNADANYTQLYFDWGCLRPPLYTLGLCTVIPHACWPLLVMSGYAQIRCLLTCDFRSLPLNMRKIAPYDAEQTSWLVHRRLYDKKTKKMKEELVVNDYDELQYALKVVGAKRQQFIDDPNRESVQYWVSERKTLNKEFGELAYGWLVGFQCDFIRYGGTFAMAWCFRGSVRRLEVDLRRWWKGEIFPQSISHPIPNFFRSYDEYQLVKHKMKSHTPKSARPWNYNL
jgi:hypothetical protein